MSSSYTDLQTYRSCPRCFGFQKLGYQSPTINEPITTGTLVHAGLAAHFKGQDPMKTVDDYYSQLMDKYDEDYENSVTLLKARNRSKELLTRYIKSWAKDYKAVLVEPILELDGVICHPDLIAYYGTPKEQRVIVDFKTSYHPDDRWFDMSNQTDLYAYVYIEALKYPIRKVMVDEPIFRKGSELIIDEVMAPELIIYDIISEEGIFRHMRPPRLSAGKRLFSAVQTLNKLFTSIEDSHLPFSTFLSDPHPDYTCPSRCDFFTPCWLLDTDSWEAARDYLEENYLHVQ